MFDPTITDVDVYGPMLVANDNLVISVIDRTYPTVAIYRPYLPNNFCTLDLNFQPVNETYLMLLAVPRDGLAAPNRFFYQGVTISDNGTQGTVWGVVYFSMSPCSYTGSYFNTSAEVSDYPLLGASTSGQIYMYTDYNFTFMYDITTTNSSFVNGTPWPDGPNFVPYAIDISYGGWGVIAGSAPIDSIYVPTLYLISFPSNVIPGGYNYNVISVWRAPFDYPWQSIIARPVSGSNDFNAMYGMSLSINNDGDILFGVQSMNTVFHLYVNSINPTSFIFRSSRIYSVTIPSIGFGKSVGWLDNTTAVILANNVSLDYTAWYSSKIEIYDLSNGQLLSDTQGPFSSFPKADQSMYSGLTGQMVLMVASYAGSVTFMDSAGSVYIILPSPSAYYTATNIGNNLGAQVFFSSSALCLSGTYTQAFTGSKYLFNTCEPCPEGTYNPGSMNTTSGCLPCDTTKYFCPFGAVAEVSLSYMTTISQATSFPKSPDLTEFEDILLLNMFNTNFEGNCLTTTPFFWALIMTGIGFAFLITMGIIKLSGKCENYRTKIESVFRHFDLINEGERWMGGVLSFTIILIIIFAAIFTSSFINQYPIATSREPDFTCDETLRNSKFSSHMQALGAPVPNDAKEIFNLLASQNFMLTVTLLNTIVNTNVTVEQTVGIITTKLQTNLSVPTNGCLMISISLTANIAIISINILGSQMIGGVGINLSAPGIIDGNNNAKELNFYYSFSTPNRTMSQDPYFSMELIQIINETRPLSLDAASKYSGLWIPTFSQDVDQNFYTFNDFQKYHQQLSTILTIDITEAAYYVYNIEKPIIKTTEVIFKNILFVTMCMELVGFAFLIMKLAIVPLIRLIILLACSKEEKSDEEKDDVDSKKEEEEEEHISNDEQEETPRQIKLEPGKNEWYMPDVEI